MIHPSAILDSSARMGDGVEIGPGCVISAGVEIGDHCRLHAHVVIYPGTKMGEANVIHSGAVLGDSPQDLSFDPATTSFLVIGDGTVIREHVTVHRGSQPGSSTLIGDDCYLMAGSHVGHDCAIGDRSILANQALLGGHVQVHEQVFFGGGAVAHQHTRVGRLAIIQGSAAFSKDVPPFTMAAGPNAVVGLNVVGLKRAGVGLPTRNEIKTAFNLIYRSGLNVSQALAASQATKWGPEATEFFTFIRQSQRGICPLRRSE